MRWSSEPPPVGPRVLAVLAALAALAATGRAQDGKGAERDEAAEESARVEVLDVYFPEALARNLRQEGAWLAAYFELKTTGAAAETVVIESVVEENKGRSFEARQAVEVAPGAPRRAWAYFHVKPGDGARSQSLRLAVRDAAGRTLRTDGPWQTSTGGQPLSVLVVQEKVGIDISPWPGELSQRRGGHEFSEAVASCAARKLPDRVEGYHGMSLVVLRSVTDAALEPAQLEALRAWVSLGGRVVLAPSGRSGEIFQTELARAFLGGRLATEPRVEHEFQPLHLHAVDEASRSGGAGRELDQTDRIDFPADRSYTRIDPLAGQGDRELYSRLDGAAPGDAPGEATERRRVYSESEFGRGAVGVLTIDDQTHRTAETGLFLQALWAYITARSSGGHGRFAEIAARTVPTDGLVDRLKEKRDVGIGFLVGLITGYLVLVGPVLFFVLKRLRRLPSVIWVEPLLVVVYLGVIFTTAYITKGVLTTTRQYSVLSQSQGQPLAFRESFLSLFAAAETTFRIAAPAGSLLLPLFRNEQEEQPVRLARSKEGQPSLQDLRLAQWQGGYAVSLGVVDLGGDGVGVEDLVVTNQLVRPLGEGMVRYQGQWRRVPRLEPGQTAQATADTADGEAFRELRKLAEPGLTGRDANRLLFAAFLEGGDPVWSIDQRTTLKERKDVYLLYE